MMKAFFVALEIPDPVRQELCSLKGDLAGVRWLGSERYHLTLAYLGPLGIDRVNDLMGCLNSIKHGPIALELDSLELYPMGAEPRAIVALATGNDSLNSLRQKVNRAAVESGLVRKRERYCPHVTIGRFSPQGRVLTRPELVADYLAQRSQFSTEPFELYTFSLYSSQRTAADTEYEIIREYDLI